MRRSTTYSKTMKTTPKRRGRKQVSNARLDVGDCWVLFPNNKDVANRYTGKRQVKGLRFVISPSVQPYLIQEVNIKATPTETIVEVVIYSKKFQGTFHPSEVSAEDAYTFFCLERFNGITVNYSYGDNPVRSYETQYYLRNDFQSVVLGKYPAL